MPMYRVTAHVDVLLEILVEAPDAEAAQEAAGCEPAVAFNDNGAAVGSWSIMDRHHFEHKIGFSVEAA
ncbi:hypothetical protein UFOVP1382_78 [uncultured Caudovirales phage]|uniref:Uncharacterized protein n=1 Tax=uncultured Caudovirales phage TaxID=2100421 RepID=A0A6J5S4H6_9CAUD|nr:hypothetical protein UFOVP1382_78 [uncultured Caudovirales phage]